MLDPGGGAAHAQRGASGCHSRQDRAHDPQRRQGTVSAGSDPSAVQSRAPQPALGLGFQCAAASGVRDEGMAPRHRLAGAGGKPP